jgi:hypothetical protein
MTWWIAQVKTVASAGGRLREKMLLHAYESVQDYDDVSYIISQ